MRAFYSLGIQLYLALIYFASFFNAKAKLWLIGRKHLLKTIKKEVKGRNIIWFHAASVGEFEQARPLIELIKHKLPEKQILITFFSPSAYELRKDYELADYIYYLPSDLKSNVSLFLDAVKPQMVFFVKYEFWFNYINEINKRRIPLYLISGIFRPKQHFFKWYGKWFSKHLKMFNKLFIQDEASAKLLESIGIKNYSVTGDTRFDRVNTVIQNPKKFDCIKEFIGEEKILLCGSSWAPDEAIILNYLEKHPKQLKLIIAPHEVNSSHIEEIEKSFKAFNPIKLSDIENGKKLDSNRVLIIDSVGKLIYLYQYADIAYIGGGFGVGIHNILEAACYGKTVFFGPNYQKFKEARDMIEIGAATSIANKDEFETKLSSLLNSEKLLQQKSNLCFEYVNKNLGTSDEIFNSCF